MKAAILVSKENNHMKKLFLVVLASIMVLSVAGCGNKGGSETAQSGAVEMEAAKDFPVTVKMDKTEYKPGEEITVTFSNEDWYVGSDAWVGIIPSEIEHGDETLADEYDIEYYYLESLENGKAVFYTLDAGKYDIRVFTSDDEGEEILYIPFTIAG
jgi:hypothetical protein